MKKVIIGLSVLFLLSTQIACNKGTAPATVPTSETTPVVTWPTPLLPTPGETVFRSDQLYLTVRVPPTWVAVDGPGYISPKTLYGQVAFNSWGEPGFWARDLVQGNLHTYNAETVMSQIPNGGAYVVLLEIGAPPPATQPTQYLPNNLAGLLKLQDWRLGFGYQSFEFYKWGTLFGLQIACSPNASDETVANINRLLQSWQYDQIPIGNVGWAFTIANQLLPGSVQPLQFPDRSGTHGNRQTEATVGTDNTVHFRFTYYWTSPDNSQHWWNIDVLPNGKAISVNEGGDPLTK